MSGRCKACNKKFTESEMLAKNYITKEPEDLCGKCRSIIGLGQDDKEESGVTIEEISTEDYKIVEEVLIANELNYLTSP